MSKRAGFLNPLYESGKLKGYNKDMTEEPAWSPIFNEDYNKADPTQQALANAIVKGLNKTARFKSFSPISREDSTRVNTFRPLLKKLAQEKTEYDKMLLAEQEDLRNNFNQLKEHFAGKNIPINDINPYNINLEPIKQSIMGNYEPKELAPLFFKDLNGKFIPKEKAIRIDPHGIREKNKSSINTLIHEGTHGLEEYYADKKPAYEISEYFNKDSGKIGKFRKYVGSVINDPKLKIKMPGYTTDLLANNEVMARLMPNLHRTDWAFPPAPENLDRNQYKQTEHHHNRKLLRSLLKNERDIFGKAGLNSLLANENKDDDLFSDNYSSDASDSQDVKDAKLIYNNFSEKIRELKKPFEYRKTYSGPTQYSDLYNTQNNSYPTSPRDRFEEFKDPSKDFAQGGYIKAPARHNRDRHYNQLVNYLQRYLR